jgi:hypothetical protein
MSSLLLLWPKSQGTSATKIANVNLAKTKKTNYLQVVKIGVKVLKEIHFQLQILLDKKVVVRHSVLGAKNNFYKCKLQFCVVSVQHFQFVWPVITGWPG